MRILLVEDEENIREAVKLNLDLDGYEVIAVGNAKDALAAANGQHFDLMILDVMLPDVDGFQLCQQIRLLNTDVPIMFLTAKDTPEDRVQGLRKGADDYLVKPFNIEELGLRVQNLLRRAKKEGMHIGDTFTFGQFEINFHTFEANTLQGKMMLTKKEAMLLKLLIERRNDVVSRQQILQSVWGYDVYPSTRTIDNFILTFRKYFEKDPRSPTYFHSVRSVGYKFTLED